ncbi:MAG: RNA polymerase sigma factor [Myxococcaceae bacterium]
MTATPALTIEQQIRDAEPVLRRFALRAVRDVELAKELVQETLLAGLSNAGTFNQRSQVRTWLISIFSHKAADHFRRQQHQPYAFDGDERSLLETPSAEDVERSASARQELGRVEKALTTLNEQERLAILMVDVESVDREEVCRAMQVTATHLRVLLHRGRNRLRKALERGE